MLELLLHTRTTAPMKLLEMWSSPWLLIRNAAQSFSPPRRSLQKKFDNRAGPLYTSSCVLGAESVFSIGLNIPLLMLSVLLTTQRTLLVRNFRRVLGPSVAWVIVNYLLGHRPTQIPLPAYTSLCLRVPPPCSYPSTLVYRTLNSRRRAGVA